MSIIKLKSHAQVEKQTERKQAEKKKRQNEMNIDHYCTSHHIWLLISIRVIV